MKVIPIVAMAAITITSTGCPGNVDVQVQQDGNAIAIALLNIAAQEQALDPTISAKLVQIANDLKAATANFSTGGSIAIVNDALTAASIVLASIPQTAAFAPLVPIAEAAIDILIANIGGTPAPTTVAAAHARIAGPHYTYPSAQIPHRIFRSPQGDFKAAWNDTAKKNGLKQALIP